MRRGATEASLVEQGLRVVAVPVDPVFASSARAKGVEIVEGDVATVRKKLDGEQFDCLLLSDVLHLIQDPSAVMSALVPLLRVGATMIVRVPMALRFTTACRVIRGDQRFRELGIYEKTGMNFISRGSSGDGSRKQGCEWREYRLRCLLPRRACLEATGMGWSCRDTCSITRRHLCKLLAESAGLRGVSLETQRNPAVGTSLRYVWDDVFRAVGIRRTPVVYQGQASLPWRAPRKLVRMTALRFLLALAPLAGGGESIHAIFRKENTGSEVGH